MTQTDKPAAEAGKSGSAGQGRKATASRSSSPSSRSRSGTASRATRPRTSGTRTSSVTAAVQAATKPSGNGSAAGARLPSGVPEAALKNVVLPRSQATGLEAPASHLSPAERRVRGKAARALVPREQHAEWQPPAVRPDPVDLLESQAASRVPDLVPVRYGRMMESPFTYYRGAALPMASDLAHTPSTGLIVQACGDAHLSNFGIFASPERKLMFDVNDFDETLPGPWEWDVKRLAASMEVAARTSNFSDKDRKKILLATAFGYRNMMRTMAGLGNLDVWYTQVDIEELRTQFADQLTKRQRKAVDKGLVKARTRDSTQELRKLTTIENGRPQIVPDPPVIVPIRDLLGDEFKDMDLPGMMKRLIGQYRRSLQADRRVLLEQFEIVDMAHKVVGVGSVGTRCWIVLMLGRDETDPLFLQVKEAQDSVLCDYAWTSKYDNQGERVVNGQRLMQAASDIFLGWQRATGLDGKRRDFYIRQLRDWKFSVDIGTLIPKGMRLYGQLCGATLARAHARSGDEIAIASYLGSSAVFDNAIAEFAAAYADQNERDYQAFTAAIESGRLHAERGV